MPISRLIDVGERIPAANMTRVAASVNASSSVIFSTGRTKTRRLYKEIVSQTTL